jgi:hypothetical protein
VQSIAAQDSIQCSDLVRADDRFLRRNFAIGVDIDKGPQSTRKLSVCRNQAFRQIPSPSCNQGVTVAVRYDRNLPGKPPYRIRLRQHLWAETSTGREFAAADDIRVSAPYRHARSPGRRERPSRFPIAEGVGTGRLWPVAGRHSDP